MQDTEIRYDRVYHAYGAAAELFQTHCKEVLIEGGAGTGKTHAVLRRIDLLNRTYPLHPSHPKPRTLMVRQTRKSMTESVLQEFEDYVLWPGHPAIVGDAHRSNRDHYVYPKGGEVILGGMDNPDKIMSTQYDFVAFFEATEGYLEPWEKLMSRVRHHAIPHPNLPEPYCQGFMPDGRTLWEAFRQGEFHETRGQFYDGSSLFLEQGVADCNPGPQYHWLNLRADEVDKKGKPVMKRLLSRHEDNPTITQDYLDTLAGYTGVQRQRLYLHMWVSESGQVWSSWDPNENILKGAKVSRGLGGGWQLEHERFPKGPVRLGWFAASVDWGFYPDPGAMILAGFDDYGRMYIIRQLEFLNRHTDWWVDQLINWHFEWPLSRVVCDHDIERKKVFNDRLQARGAGRITTNANKNVDVGLDLVRDALAVAKDRYPRIFVLDDSMEMRDEQLIQERRPYSIQTEIGSYVYPKTEEGKANKLRPDPACDDHLMDCLRYLSMYAWGKDLGAPKDRLPTYPEGSFGYVHKHREKLKRAYGWQS